MREAIRRSEISVIVCSINDLVSFVFLKLRLLSCILNSSFRVELSILSPTVRRRKIVLRRNLTTAINHLSILCSASLVTDGKGHEQTPLLGRSVSLRRRVWPLGSDHCKFRGCVSRDIQDCAA
jgi:hypothetical protein